MSHACDVPTKPWAIDDSKYRAFLECSRVMYTAQNDAVVQEAKKQYSKLKQQMFFRRSSYQAQFHEDFIAKVLPFAHLGWSFGRDKSR